MRLRLELPSGQALTPVAVLSLVNFVRLRAPDAHVAVAAGCRDGVLVQRLLQCRADLERRLAAKLHDDALGPLHLQR